MRFFSFFSVASILFAFGFESVEARPLSLGDPETWQGHQGAVMAVSYTPDGRLVSGGADGAIRLWGRDRAGEGSTLRGHKGTVRTLRFSSDGKILVSGGDDRTVRLWNPDKRRVRNTLSTPSPTRSLAMSADRLWLATAQEDRAVALWNFRQPKRADILPLRAAARPGVCFIPGENLLAVALDSGKVVLWDPFIKETVGELPGAGAPLDVSPDGRWLASGKVGEDAVMLWDVERRASRAIFRAHIGPIATLAFSPDSRWLASGSEDNTIRVWDTRRQRQTDMRDEERPVWALAFSPDGQTLVAGEDDGIIRRWPVRFAPETTPPEVLSNTTTTTLEYAGSEDGWASSGARRPEALGVILGVETYRYAPSVPFAGNDARAMKDFFLRGLGIEEQNLYVRVDGEATQGEFRKLFDPGEGWLARRVRPGFTEVFVYYVGHGAPELSSSEAYLMPSDSDPNYPSTGYRLGELYRSLEQLSARQVTVMIDACFSGQSGRGNAVEMLLAGARGLSVEPRRMSAGEQTVVFTASSGSQISSSYPEKGHGLFTYFLIQGLRGKADANADRSVTAGELHAYVREQVREQAGRLDRDQTPELIGQDMDRVLARY